MLITLFALALLAPNPKAVLDTSKKASPPPPYAALLKSLPGSGFHVNTRLAAPGYVEASVCSSSFNQAPHPRSVVCDGLVGSWWTSIVADKKDGGGYVVQELWVFAYEDSAQAAGAASAVDDLTFSKHPFVGFSSGRFLYYIEGRFRFGTARKRLSDYVFKVLTKTAPKLVRL